MEFMDWTRTTFLLSVLYSMAVTNPVDLPTYGPPKMLLVSFDGFRWDYLDMAKKAGRETPNFDEMIQAGVKADWVKNTFATVTFPNHYTIATGLYEENHGVVANEMYDPVFDEVFTKSGDDVRDPKWWDNGTDDWTGEPIWITNQRAGCRSGSRTHRTGVYFWVGSEAPVRGEYAFHYEKYNKDVPFHTRSDTIVNWFTDDETPINLGLLYFHEPDATGHQYGPDSPEMLDTIVEMDGVLGHLLGRLKKEGLMDELNIILTSDHGMEPITNVIHLDDFVDPNSYKAYGGSPISHILPAVGKEDEVFANLSLVPDIHVYKKEDIPADYHYTNNRRIMPIVLETKLGFDLCHNSCTPHGGNHGWNNSLPSMHPFFIARGPAFKEGYKSKPFNNVDIYPLMCHVLQVTPAQHDGGLENIRHILAEDNHHMLSVNYCDSQDAAQITSNARLLTITVLGMLCILLVGGVAIAAWRSKRVQEWRQSNSVYKSVDDNSRQAIETSGHALLWTSDEEDIP